MKKLIVLAITLALVLSIASFAEGVGEGYPGSGITPPEGSAIIKGELIGSEMGWGDNADAGRAAAFDGDILTFFDPLGVGDGYAGIDAGEEYVLTHIAIHPRDGQLLRYDGAQIEGSNDNENWEIIWTSDMEADEWKWFEIPADQFLIKEPSFRYYRYFNELNHGDVGEVELYGYSKAAAAAAAAEPEPVVVVEEAPAEPAAEPAPVAEPAPADAAPAAAPQTADMTALIVVTAVAAFGCAVLVTKRK
jgi:hypothetical protein